MSRPDLVALRHELHAHPEVSGEEKWTAARMAAYLRDFAPDHLLTGLGGHGVAAVFEGAAPGPTVLFRAELDGLPIEEISTAPHRSQEPGKGHLCGHDGHMVMVAGLARGLAERRPARGRAVLLLQPAEETGQGARAVMDDPQFARITPDYAFALHNLPGREMGRIALCDGPTCCASRGMEIRLTGKTSHAAAPDEGRSPMMAMAGLMPALSALSRPGALDDEFALVTLTHAALGEPAFGISPGAARIFATLRTVRDARMADLVARAEALARDAAEAEGLGLEIAYHEVFDACTNAPEAVALLRRALAASGSDWAMDPAPQRFSEDFGQFGQVAPTAMFFLGSGRATPKLHNPDFDFPDQLIAPGMAVFEAIIDDLLR